MKYFIALSLSLLVVTPIAVSCQTGDAPIRAVLVDAIKARMGADTEVIVDRVQIFTRDRSACASPAVCQATPDPAARTGRTIRFALSVIRRDGATTRFERIGSAEAEVFVNADVTRTTAAVRRGEPLSAARIESVRQSLVNRPLRRLPAVAELLSATALRDIAPGETIAPGMVLVPPAIRTGQHVTAVSRLGGVEVSATLMASESGVSGDIIRMVNPDSRRALRARILSPSRVEIVQ